MNIKRFHAATSREALAKARMAFGEGTLILSNRPTANGVEVVATAEDTLGAMEPGNAALHEPQLSSLQARASDDMRRPAGTAQPAPPSHQAVEADTEQLAMSTLSFQDYVRERMLRRRHEALHGKSDHGTPEPAAPGLPTFAERARHFDPESTREQPVARERTREPERQMVQVISRNNPVRSIPMDLPVEPPRRRAEAPAMSQQGLMNELQAMKELIEDRFNTLSWLGQAKQNPIQSNLMLKLIRAGYSPALARAVLERLPEEMGAGEAVRWLMEVLERNLKTDAHDTPIYEEGGIFALVGSTGVGKTTTTAKLAALCARLHGPGSVGLITLDTYRVGAHEQLRSFGRMLGVVAHLAHDRAALQDLLGLLSSKKMVLIDTTGIAPRDPRKQDMLGVLDLPDVQRLLVLNASSHGDTLDDVLGSFKTEGPQQAILSKVDEAVKLGPAMDALIRHQTLLRGVTNGQRVPEDWEAADARQLIAHSMRAPAKSAFDPKSVELNFFFSQGSERGLAHA